MRTRHLVMACFALALGCSSDVDTVDGGGGSGTTSASATVGVTSGPTTSTTVATTAAVTSSSTGGGNTCEQGCAHLAKCGLDVCGQVGIDCQDPNTECPMGCVLDASCADLTEAIINMAPPPALAACLGACQGGTGGGGGGMQGCGQCAFGADCFQGCFNDPDCQAWGQCAAGCSDPQCYADCNAMNPAAADSYGPIYACVCAACSSECGAQMDPCNQGMGTGGAGGS